jgi:hypothetical protein
MTAGRIEREGAMTLTRQEPEDTTVEGRRTSRLLGALEAAWSAISLRSTSGGPATRPAPRGRRETWSGKWDGVRSTAGGAT